MTTRQYDTNTNIALHNAQHPFLVSFTKNKTRN